MKILIFIFGSFLFVTQSLSAQTSGCTGSASISVTIEDCTATNNIPGIKSFVVTPNPAVDMANIFIETTEKITGTVRLIDASGKILFQEKIDSVGVYSKTINISQFSAGIYWAVFQNSSSVASRKLVIQ